MGAGVPLQRDIGAAQYDRRGAIAAHGVEGDRDAAVHRRLSCPVVAALGGRGGLRYDLAPIIVSAGRAKMMRPLQLTAIWALGVGRRAQRMMRAAHLAS